MEFTDNKIEDIDFSLLGNEDNEAMDFSFMEKVSKSSEQKEDNKASADVIPEDELFASDDEEQEGVGAKGGQEGTPPEDVEDSSPKIYPTLAKALADDGILTLDNELLEAISDADSFAKAIKAQTESLLTEQQARVTKALDNGVQPDKIRQFENAISYLDDIEEDTLKAETPESEELRRNLIYQDYVNRGFKPERAKREVERSFNAGTDAEDAMAALESNKEFFSDEYDALLEDAEKKANEQKEKDKQFIDSFKTMVLSNDEPIRGVKLDKTQKQNIFDTATKPVGKDANGNPITAIQKYALENKADYQYKVNLLYTLTNGFKDLDSVVKPTVKKKVGSALSSLEKVLQGSKGSFNTESRGTQSSSFLDGMKLDL